MAKTLAKRVNLLTFIAGTVYMALGACSVNTEISQILPGAETHSIELLSQLETGRKQLPKNYQPRTRHLNQKGWAKYTNRLLLESSPYLLQHAHNPVNWWPWSQDAFEKARKEKKPILLSVGYSTCHWCHVMEEESFEDEEIAAFINQNYVAIKVDREERPDVDAIYMTAVQAISGQGGWPMTVWLTPEAEPFFGGTYFPARDGDRGSRFGFLTLLRQLHSAYKNEAEKVKGSAQHLSQVIRQAMDQSDAKLSNDKDSLPSQEILKKAYDFYARRFDSFHGGMEGAPKFPSSLPLRFLIRYWQRFGEINALKMAEITLNKMAAGGMYDQIAGGFHRYSVDERWLIPHFEKMLYDNALLALDYLEAYQATKKDFYREVLGEILNYIQVEMTSSEGAFYSATDADSLTPSGHREEGYYFSWTPEELEKTLGAELAKSAAAYWKVTPDGNFEHSGRTVLSAPQSVESCAEKLKLKPHELEKQLQQAKDKLLKARQARPAPLLDDKILTAWNALMISAFARAGLVLDNETWLESAKRGGQFILQKLRDPQNGKLFRSYNRGQAKISGFLEDYAFSIAAFLDLYEATGELHWLKNALEWEVILSQHFGHAQGGYYSTSDDQEKLIAREKPSHDGATPSGNSVMALNLVRLHALTLEDSYRQKLEKLLNSYSRTLQKHPASLSELLLAVNFYSDHSKEVVLLAPSGARPDSLLKAWRESYFPHQVMIALDENQIRSQEPMVPILKEKVAVQGKSSAYVCQKGVCKLPTQDPEELKRLLE